MTGRVRYGKDSLRIGGVRKWGHGKEVRRVERMDGGEGRRSEDDNWGRF